MVIFDFNSYSALKDNSRPCIRINIYNSKDRVEYPSISAAAEDLVYNAHIIRKCCNNNRNLRSPVFRVKDWFFIYKD